MLHRRHFLTGLALLPALVASARTAHAMDSDYYSKDGIAINGADAVAYFLDSAAVAGDPRHALMWRGAVWHFASMHNRDAFEMDPNAFAPRFGGYCALSVAEGELVSSDPTAFTIHQGRLYLNYSLDIRALWRADMPRFIASAEANWPAILTN